MERFYQLLYRFNFQHDFYAKGDCADFECYPLGNTFQKLNGLRMLFKNQLHGFDLISQVHEDSGEPIFPIEEKTTLYFGFKPVNNSIFNITQFPDKENDKSHYYTSVSYTDEKAELETVTVKHYCFTQRFQGEAQSAILKLKNENEETLMTLKVPGVQDEGDEGGYHYTFSVLIPTQVDEGIYSLILEEDEVVTSSETIFLMAQSAKHPVFGIIQVTLDENMETVHFPYQTALQFNAIETKWIYHIELTRDFTSGKIEIINSDEESTLKFIETSELEAYKTGETVVFESDTVIKRKQTPINTLNLEASADGIDYTMNGLPNPSLNTINSTIYLKI